MTAPALPADDPLYDTKSAAEFLRCSVSTLERRRLAGNGPRYHKAPGKRSKILYPRSFLIAWINANTFGSTSEYGQ